MSQCIDPAVFMEADLCDPLFSVVFLCAFRGAAANLQSPVVVIVLVPVHACINTTWLVIVPCLLTFLYFPLLLHTRFITSYDIPSLGRSMALNSSSKTPSVKLSFQAILHDGQPTVCIYKRPCDAKGAEGKPRDSVSSLVVEGMTSNEEALSNVAYMNVEQFDAMGDQTVAFVVAVTGAGATVYLPIRPHLAVPKGILMTNGPQRTALNVRSGAEVKVAPVSVPVEASLIVKLGIDVTLKQGRDPVVDCKQLAVEVCKQLQGQPLMKGRVLVMSTASNQLLGITIGDVTTLQPTAAPFTIASPEVLKEECVFITTSDAKVQLANLSTQQLDAAHGNVVRSFDLVNLGIGGLSNEFGEVFQRAFASRLLPPSVLEKLGVKHVKGVLLYGPPGTGKTLIARKIGEILECHPPKIVNGPEIFNKYVGEAEKNIRELFKEAEDEQAKSGDQSRLHLIIFDEFDAICKQRGSSNNGTNTGDNVVNQLLSKIDGVTPLNNVLLIGMTNRKDLLDEAILRPGRFEVHVEVGLPTEEGRVEIFHIHTAKMRENGKLAADVDLLKMAQLTRNYSGAEIEGVVRAATSYALLRHTDMKEGRIKDAGNIVLRGADFESALTSVQPAFGKAEDACRDFVQQGLSNYGPKWQAFWTKMQQTVGLCSHIGNISVLLTGCSGCGKTAIAASLAVASGFPYVKVISADSMVGYSDMQRVNIIRKAFEDASKSPESCVILDDLERLINFSALGGRYSNDVLQALLVLVKRPPITGRKLLVIGTASSMQLMEELELSNVFPLHSDVPLVPSACIGELCQQRNYVVDGDLTGLPPQPIKTLLLQLEMVWERDGVVTKPALSDADSLFR